MFFELREMILVLMESCEGVILQFFVITNNAPMVLTLPTEEEESVPLAYTPEPVEWFLLDPSITRFSSGKLRAWL